MKEIYYEITFHTDWHCGSGLAAGADVDALVIKDKNGLPFVPGKTIKGLLREASEDIAGVLDSLDWAFGKENNSQNADGVKSILFFSDATIREEEQKAIVANQLSQYMYRTISSTAIDDGGIAKDNSLRKVQVTVPCRLYGKVVVMSDNLDKKIEELSELLEKAFAYVKRLGVGRNRGLGRCTIKRIEEGGSK